MKRTVIFTLLALMMDAVGASESDFTNEQTQTLTILAISFSALSLIGSLFILFMFSVDPELRSFMFRLVFWIAVCDVGTSVSFMFGAPADGSFLCYIQAVLQQFFQVAGMFWTTAIAYSIDQVFLKQINHSEVEGLYPKFQLIIWTASALLLIPPAASGVLGATPGWCWISVNTNPQLGMTWRFLCFYVPLWIIFAYNLKTLFNVRTAINNLVGQGEVNESSVKRLAQMVYYPLILVCCYFFATLHRLVSACGHVVYGIVVLSVIGQTLLGTINAVVYGYTPAVRHSVIKLVYGLEYLKKYLDLVKAEKKETTAEV